MIYCPQEVERAGYRIAKIRYLYPLISTHLSSKELHRNTVDQRRARLLSHSAISKRDKDKLQYM